MKLKLAIVVFLAGSAGNLLAQSKHALAVCCDFSYATNAVMDTVTIVVEGNISDFESQKGIAGAEVVFKSETGLTHKTITNTEGKFLFRHINNGKYSVVIKKKGYCVIKRSEVTIGSGWIINMKACMAKK